MTNYNTEADSIHEAHGFIKSFLERDDIKTVRIEIETEDN